MIGGTYFATQRFRRSDVRPTLELVTPGNTDLEGVTVRLVLWTELRRDLRLSKSQADEVGVGEFFEEGQVEPGEES
jgi:hypothetical protein